jgi:hypothetical protein
MIVVRKCNKKFVHSPLLSRDFYANCAEHYRRRASPASRPHLVRRRRRRMKKERRRGRKRLSQRIWTPCRGKWHQLAALSPEVIFKNKKKIEKARIFMNRFYRLRYSYTEYF